MSTTLSGEETIAAVRKRQAETLLAFSLGKDAVAAWLGIQRHFARVIPVYMYLVPGLEFVQESIDYYERFFGERIIQMPHPSLHRWLNGHIFRPPQQCAVVEQAGLPNHSYEDVFAAVRQDHGLDPGLMYATGVRAADSPMRLVALKTHGSIHEKGLKYHPVWDWKKADLLREFRRAGVKLAPDYRVFGRTFDGLDVRFLGPMKRHFPRDYQRVLEMFPLAELELYRFERAA
ncbi:phosphoadenosine phosphosulfate reductase [Orrella sp. JC864]|uniref:phosphoadenosine phosphosulfate reductase n=1 Tax=Orrella sp. JC864 TaxID=3120298 RepID=UPI00300B96A9